MEITSKACAVSGRTRGLGISLSGLACAQSDYPDQALVDLECERRFLGAVLRDIDLNGALGKEVSS